MSLPEVGQPGFGTERTTTPRRVIRNHGVFLGGGLVIDGSLSRDTDNTGNLDVLRAGNLLGKITASGLFAPSILGTLSVAHTSNSATSMTLTAAAATELSRRIGSSGTFKLTGPPTANGTVATATITYSAVNTTTGVVTISTESTDFVAGSFVQPTDGSEDPLVLIPDTNGIKVTDEDAASIDVPLATPLIGGVIDSSQLVHWPSDTGLQDWIQWKLNGGALATPATGPFQLDHNFGA